MYERSYMHRDNVTHVLVAKTDFIITCSKDGVLKFWKKTPVGIEFVKVRGSRVDEKRECFQRFFVSFSYSWHDETLTGVQGSH